MRAIITYSLDIHFFNLILNLVLLLSRFLVSFVFFLLKDRMLVTLNEKTIMAIILLLLLES